MVSCAGRRSCHAGEPGDVAATLFPVKIFCKEQHLVVDAIVPVGAIMSSGAFGIVMIDLHLHQLLVEGPVYGEKEVVDAAVEDQL
jgi:hypothetical protein